MGGVKDVLLWLLVLHVRWWQLVLYAWQWELYGSYLRSFVTPTEYIDR